MRLIPKFITRWFERFVERLAYRISHVLLQSLSGRYHRILNAIETEGGFAVTAYTDAKDKLALLAQHIADLRAGTDKQIADAVASAVAGKDQVITERDVEITTLSTEIEDLKSQIAAIDATFEAAPVTTPANTPVIPTGEGDETTHVAVPADVPVDPALPVAA